MVGQAAMLALMASLTFVDAACSSGQEPIATGSIPRAAPLGQFDGKRAARAGFGFSPFLEEGLVAAMPRARAYEIPEAVPAYLRDLRKVAD